MKAILALLFTLVPLQAQELPHAFPREGAKQLVDNERVTVWDVTWPKGKPSPMHRHRYDLAGVYLVGSLIRITLPDGTIRESTVDEGYVHFQREGITHIEEGMVEDRPRHAILIDLKNHAVTPPPRPAGLPPAFPREGARNRFENERIAVWEYGWTEEATPLHFHDRDLVAVVMEGGEIESTTPDGRRQVTRIARGEASFAPGNRAHSERRVSGTPRAILVELK
jgi:quercetin dioxygenase-like cupin family protein